MKKYTNREKAFAQLLVELMIEVRELKENVCENSGWNWYERIADLIQDIETK